ncbi:MAG: NUDIX domain-containing protein [Candidatus Pacearchaeota archaeon]|nr:NUDIX domain-containing protein [Candidatus Pacearchaeota archaeon]
MIKVLTWNGVRNWKDFEFAEDGGKRVDIAKLRYTGKSAIYTSARSVLTRACNDILAWYPSDNPGLIMIERNQEPAKGQEWCLGGGLTKGDGLESSVRRKFEEETGLKLEDELILLGHALVSWETTSVPCELKGSHEYAAVIFGKTKPGQVRLDETSSKYHIVTPDQFFANPNKYHPYVREYMRTAIEIGTGQLRIPEVGSQFTTQSRTPN